MIEIKKQDHKLWIAILFLVDVILCAAGFVSGCCLIDGNFISSGEANIYIIVFASFLIVFFVTYDLYKTKSVEVFNSMVAATLSVLFSGVGTFLTAFIFKWNILSVWMWFSCIFSVWVLTVIWRMAAALFIKKFGNKRRCLIIENVKNTSRLARKLKYASNEGLESVYYMIDEKNETEMEILLEKKINEFDLIFISPAISQNAASRIMGKAFTLGKDISVLADLNSISTFRGSIYQIDDTPVIEKKGVYITKAQRVLKRFFDIVFALMLSVVFSPLFLICAIAIKLDSEGPVFYKQERYTIHKKVFNLYKFRTMVQDAEKDGAQFAQENDPRITRVGKVLRAMRIDELPQIYNILTGSMSVVGPRPERPVFADYFSKTVRDYDIRYCVKAGLTGYAQIYGKYNTRVSDKILMDIIYIVNYSFLLDIKIILLTGKTMFVKESTEGVDDEKDIALSSVENEDRRREETFKRMGIKDEDIYHNTGV